MLLLSGCFLAHSDDVGAGGGQVVNEPVDPAVPEVEPPPVTPVVDPIIPIVTPEDARLHKLESLRTAVKNDGGPPLPPNLANYVVNKQAAIQLGKALFWDMKMGSDGVQACASCHFSAGADNRSRNSVNPGLLRVKDSRADDIMGYHSAPAMPDTAFHLNSVDKQLAKADYPLVKNVESVIRNADGSVGPGQGNSNDVVSSMGMFFSQFAGTTAGTTTDKGIRLNDPVFNVNGVTKRRVPPRNAPTTINAVLNYANFWDGRANNTFNGVNPFGDQDPNASVFVKLTNGTLSTEKASLTNASLASQAAGPPLSPFEMSHGNPDAGNARTYAEIGKKLLRSDTIPLERQLVDTKDSVLGTLSAYPTRGLKTNYRALIKAAFNSKYWDYRGTVTLTKTTLVKVTATQPTVACTYTVQAPAGTAEPTITKEGVYSQMEANFALFVGLSIMMYESTLISDQTPFDQWMETGTLNDKFNADALAGLNLFTGKGHCVNCHGGPELTNASVRNAEKGKNLLEAMVNFRGPTLYDNGFYNIGITPTTDDLGRGGTDLNGRPLGWSRQSLMKRVLGTQFPFSIQGDSQLRAIGEDGEIVCTDTNANGICDANEPINPAFKRAAVDGSFKVPGLRNQELMAPYMHNGGLATLRQVVEFYNRGGNFCRTNSADLDADIEKRDMTSTELDQLVSFLLSLTDPRVKLEQAPFDHPELFIPATGSAEGSTNTAELQRLPQVGQTGVLAKVAQPVFMNLNPRDSIYTPTALCSPDLK